MSTVPTLVYRQSTPNVISQPKPTFFPDGTNISICHTKTYYFQNCINNTMTKLNKWSRTDIHLTTSFDLLLATAQTTYVPQCLNRFLIVVKLSQRLNVHHGQHTNLRTVGFQKLIHAGKYRPYHAEHVTIRSYCSSQLVHSNRQLRS